MYWFISLVYTSIDSLRHVSHRNIICTHYNLLVAPHAICIPMMALLQGITFKTITLPVHPIVLQWWFMLIWGYILAQISHKWKVVHHHHHPHNIQPQLHE